MNRLVTIVDQKAEFVEADVASIVLFKRATDLEAASSNGEDQGLETPFVVIIKRAIDEDIEISGIQRPSLVFLNSLFAPLRAVALV